MASTTTYPGPHGPDGETRRDFLNLVVGAFTGFGVIAVTWTLVELDESGGRRDCRGRAD